MNSNWLSVIGFLLFLFGFLALVLSIVNLNLSLLSFIDKGGRTLGMVIRLAMVFGGVIMVYISKMDRTA